MTSHCSQDIWQNWPTRVLLWCNSPWQLGTSPFAPAKWTQGIRAPSTFQAILSGHCQMMRLARNLQFWWNIGLKNVRLSSLSHQRVGSIGREWKRVETSLAYVGYVSCPLTTYLANHRRIETVVHSWETKYRNAATITMSFRSWLPNRGLCTDFFYLDVILKWRRFSSPGRSFSAMPKWRRLRTNDGGLTCMQHGYTAYFDHCACQTMYQAA